MLKDNFCLGGGGVTKINFIPGGNIPNLQVGNKNVMVIGPSGEVQKSKIKSKKSKENVKLTGIKANGS